MLREAEAMPLCSQLSLHFNYNAETMLVLSQVEPMLAGIARVCIHSQLKVSKYITYLLRSKMSTILEFRLRYQSRSSGSLFIYSWQRTHLNCRIMSWTTMCNVPDFPFNSQLPVCLTPASRFVSTRVGFDLNSSSRAHGSSQVHHPSLPNLQFDSHLRDWQLHFNGEQLRY
ncbi:hypothetical protein R3P38DRAFT_3273950 [Favolaschia claudopus]|uniref:Uncharacterized protein n=1 Tax=Favolaschia claudopus TaxID=2862362 RepID=A0AAW0B003_9AGAR